MDTKTVVEILNSSRYNIITIVNLQGGDTHIPVKNIADLIEQQAKQIDDMKKCSNCKCESNFAGCGCNTCVNKSEWKWDGGSGE